MSISGDPYMVPSTSKEHGTSQKTREVACLSCRSKKTKCDKTFPKCSKCNTNGTECVYVSHKKTGPKKTTLFTTKLHVEKFTDDTIEHNKRLKKSSLPEETFVDTEHKSESVNVRLDSLMNRIDKDFRLLNSTDFSDFNDGTLPNIKEQNTEHLPISTDLPFIGNLSPNLSINSSDSDGPGGLGKNDNLFVSQFDYLTPDIIKRKDEVFKEVGVTYREVCEVLDSCFAKGTISCIICKERYLRFFRKSPEKLKHLTYMIMALTAFHFPKLQNKSELFYEAGSKYLKQSDIFSHSVLSNLGEISTEEDSYPLECSYLQSYEFKATYEYRHGKSLESAFTISSSVRLAQILGYDRLDPPSSTNKEETSDTYIAYSGTQNSTNTFQSSLPREATPLTSFLNSFSVPESRSFTPYVADELPDSLSFDSFLHLRSYSKEPESSSNDISLDLEKCIDNKKPTMSVIEEKRRVFWNAFSLDKYYSLVSGLPSAFSIDSTTAIFTRLPSADLRNRPPVNTRGGTNNEKKLDETEETEEGKKEYYLHEALKKLEKGDALIELASSRILILVVSENIIKWCKTFYIITKLEEFKSTVVLENLTIKVENLIKKFSQLKTNLISIDIEVDDFIGLIFSNSFIVLYQTILKKYMSFLKSTIDGKDKLTIEHLCFFYSNIENCIKVSKETVSSILGFDLSGIQFLSDKIPFAIFFTNATKSLYQLISFLIQFERLGLNNKFGRLINNSNNVENVKSLNFDSIINDLTNFTNDVIVQLGRVPRKTPLIQNSLSYFIACSNIIKQDGDVESFSFFINY